MTDFEVMVSGRRGGKTLLVEKMANAYRTGKATGKIEGRAEMKEEIIEMIQPCLSRDPTLQKLIIEIEELK
jgi:hypothetical protein